MMRKLFFSNLDASKVAGNHFAILFLTVALTSFASSMVAGSPLFFLIKSLSETKETVTTLIAVLVAVNSVATICASFVGGHLADKVSRRSVIVLASIVLTSSMISYIVVADALLVVIIYFVQMFSMSLFQPAFTAFVADLCPLESRGKTYGKFNLFWMGSTVPAPLIGGLLSDVVGLQFAFLAAFFVSLVGLLVSLKLVKLRAAIIGGDGGGNTPADNLINNHIIPYNKIVWFFGSIGFFVGLGNGLLAPLVRDYPIYNLNLNATELGLAFSLGSSLITVLVQIPGGRLTDKYGRKPLMLFSLLGAPFIIMLGLTRSILEFIVVSACLVAFANVGFPAYQAWLMELVPSSKRARTWGLVNALSGIGMFIGPLLSTWLYESQPYVTTAFLFAALPWVVQILPILRTPETKH